MVDIQSAMAESRHGKKKIDRQKKPQDKNTMACHIKYGSHKKISFFKRDI